MLKKVLVVDDSTVFHSVYRLMLHRYGCEIVDAMNGQEALDILQRQNDFQLILLDINMPTLNGLQFMEKAASLGISKKIPIIIISSEGREEDTLRGLRLGAGAYLKKPFEQKMLHQIIEKVVTIPSVYESPFGALQQAFCLS